jgi:hypothetical protein
MQVQLPPFVAEQALPQEAPPQQTPRSSHEPTPLHLMAQTVALHRTALSQVSVPSQLTVQDAPLQVTWPVSHACVPSHMIWQVLLQLTGPPLQALLPTQSMRQVQPGGQVTLVPPAHFVPPQSTTQVP